MSRTNQSLKVSSEAHRPPPRLLSQQQQLASAQQTFIIKPALLTSASPQCYLQKGACHVTGRGLPIGSDDLEEVWNDQDRSWGGLGITLEAS